MSEAFLKCHGARSEAGGLEERLHALAQPLTSLRFALELGLLQQNPSLAKAAIRESLAELDRVFAVLADVRMGQTTLDEGRSA